MAHIVDTALDKRFAEGNPVRVGLVGAGFMAAGLVSGEGLASMKPHNGVMGGG
jgi:predicted homoserine dehydrogenase-like protein